MSCNSGDNTSIVKVTIRFLQCIVLALVIEMPSYKVRTVVIGYLFQAQSCDKHRYPCSMVAKFPKLSGTNLWNGLPMTITSLSSLVVLRITKIIIVMIMFS